MTLSRNNNSPRKWVVGNPMRGLAYSLGDMPTAGGGSFRFEIEAEATRITLELVEHLSLTPAYKLLTAMLPPRKVALYFEKRVRNEVFPVMRAQYAAQWHYKNYPSNYPHNEVIWPAHQGLGPLLLDFWPEQWVPLKLGRSQDYRKASRLTLGPIYRKFRHLLWSTRQVLLNGGMPDPPKMAGPSIAVHYQEGIDENRRNDMFWYRDGLVDPQKILVYFDTKVPKHGGNTVPRQVIDDMKSRGLNPVCLRHGMVEGDGTAVWSPKREKGTLLAKFKKSKTKPHTPHEFWAIEESQQLLENVDFWVAFYRQFGVKAHIDMEVGSDRNVAQNIALDLTDGVGIGWQRSEFLTGYGHQLGYHPHHVYFAWNSRGITDAKNSRSRIGTVLVSGFTSAGLSYPDEECRDLKAQIMARGASFVVALFDNLIFREDIYSKNMMESFYTAFLKWVLEDPTVSVVTKSKKPVIFESLDGIRPLIKQAEATGRWVNLTEVLGRLPTDASRIADISVGIGISSAVTEAVALGARGVHCDLPAMRSHPFYKWGYEKVVFDDLERLILAMKRYKAAKSSEPELGDFSRIMDQVDPFQDGQRGKRVGSYISCVLETYAGGGDQESAIQRSNELYSKTWGDDKVINLSNAGTTPLKTAV